MKNLPYILVFSRIPMALIIVLLAIYKPEYYQIWITVLMAAALITDIFDGIIARRMGISTQKLRVLDSNVDQFFWLTVIACLFLVNKAFIGDHWIWIVMVVILEALTYFVAYFKFKKTVATHSILAKIWTLSLLLFLIDLNMHSTSSWAFVVCIALGLLSRTEILLIILGLKNWATDVPSILAVRKINAGKEIKRHKLFNG